MRFLIHQGSMEFCPALVCELDSQQSGSGSYIRLFRGKNGFLHVERAWYAATVCVCVCAM